MKEILNLSHELFSALVHIKIIPNRQDNTQ